MTTPDRSPEASQGPASPAVTALSGLARGSLSERVAGELSRLIVEGVFSAHDGLPSEGALAERFGVSRTAVREAVKMLAARGLIEVRHGVGLFVSGSSVQPVSDALSLLLQRERVGPEALVEARQLLEVEIAGLAAERAVPDDLSRLERALHDLGRAEQPLEAQISADTEFHLALARAAHNPVYLAISEAVRQPLADSMRATYPVDGGPARRHREHALVFEAVRDGDAPAARRSMAAMLSTSARALGVQARPSTGAGRVTLGKGPATRSVKPGRAPRAGGCR